MSDNNSNQDKDFVSLIELLIELGQIVENGSEHDTTEQGLHDLDYNAQKPWREDIYKFSVELDESDLKHLIMGITRAEMRAHLITKRDDYRCFDFAKLKNPTWNVGSATIVPPLLDNYAERFGLDCADALVIWCKKNTFNEHVPFGGHYDWAVTYRDRLRWIEIGKAKAVNEQIWRKENSRRKKEQRREEVKQNDIVRAKIRQEYDIKRQKFLNELSRTAPERRLQIITQSDMALEAVPSNLVATTPEIIQSLDEEIKKSLLLKIDRRDRGVWGKLKRLLCD
jgi:hypothetical protein